MKSSSNSESASNPLRKTLEECATFLRECKAKGAPGAVGDFITDELTKINNPQQERKLANLVLVNFRMLKPKFLQYDFNTYITKISDALKSGPRSP